MDALPTSTVRAMLEALEREELIVGAYTDRRGRACPMLAAHRRGARAGAGAFPAAWDAFAGAGRPRPATERELAILRALLEEASAGAAPTPRPVEARDDVPAAPAADHCTAQATVDHRTPQATGQR